MNAINIAQFETLRDAVLVIDTRQPSLFSMGFVPKSINIGLGESFVETILALIPLDTPIVIVADKDDVEDSYEALQAMDYKKVQGHLEGGFEAWQAEGKRFDMIINITGEELALDMPYDDKLILVDVRMPVLYELEHIKSAENLPLNEIIDPFQLAKLDEDSNIYVYSQSGNGSVTACSVMKKEGFHNVRNIEGGYESIKGTPNLKVEIPKKS